MMVIPNEILIPKAAEMLRKGYTVTLPLKGYSMRPCLEDGRDKALLQIVEEPLKVGDVILAEISKDRWALHRIVKLEGELITMCGDGNYNPEYVKRSDVLGIAKGFYRKGRETLESVESLKYKMYWRLWIALRPVRRYLLLVWKMYYYPLTTVKSLKNRYL